MRARNTRTCVRTEGKETRSEKRDSGVYPNDVYLTTGTRRYSRLNNLLGPLETADAAAFVCKCGNAGYLNGADDLPLSTGLI